MMEQYHKNEYQPYDPRMDMMPCGLALYVPPPPSTNFQVLGDQSQTLHVSLAPGETVIAEKGAIVYMTEAITAKLQMPGGIMSALGTAVGGESIFKWSLKNETASNSYVGLTNHNPGNLIPVNMTEHPEGLLAKRGSWVCSIGEDAKTSASLSLRKNVSCMAACCGGLGVVFQTITGGSWAFLGAHGTIVTKTLAAGEEMLVDEDSLVAISPTINVDVRLAGGCATVFLGGEGLFNVVLRGPGLVVLESLSIRKLRKLFGPPERKKKSKGNVGGGNTGGN